MANNADRPRNMAGYWNRYQEDQQLIQDRLRAFEEALALRPPPQSRYSSPYGIPLPVLQTAPFQDTLAAAERLPVDATTAQPPKLSLVKMDMAQRIVVANVMASVSSCQVSRARPTRMLFMTMVAAELPEHQFQQVSDWLDQNAEALSTPLSLADESLWLLKYTDLLVKIACKFVSIEDAVQQFKDLLQSGDEAGKTYVERGVRLCGKAARVIVKDSPFTVAEQSVVAENLNYLAKGLKNERIKQLALSHKYEFVRHPKPDLDELLLQYGSFFRIIRSEYQMALHPIKKRSLLVGLRWTEYDICLATRHDLRDESYSAVEPLEDFNAMQVGPSHIFCGRCGRRGHLVYTCRAKTTADGEPVAISSEDWLKTFKSARGTMEGRQAAPKGRNGGKKKFNGSSKQSQQVAAVSDCPAAPQPPAPVVEPDF